MSKTWGGRPTVRFRQAVLLMHGTVCHLCGEDGADSADHDPPRKYLDQSLWYDPAYGRPAHRRCNVERGATLLPSRVPVVIDDAAFFDTG